MLFVYTVYYLTCQERETIIPVMAHLHSAQLEPVITTSMWYQSFWSSIANCRCRRAPGRYPRGYRPELRRYLPH